MHAMCASGAVNTLCSRFVNISLLILLKVTIISTYQENSRDLGRFEDRSSRSNANRTAVQKEWETRRRAT